MEHGHHPDVAVLVARPDGFGLARASVKRRIASARSFWKFLMVTEEVTSNPFWPLAVPKGTRQLPRFLEQGQVHALWPRFPSRS